MTSDGTTRSDPTPRTLAMDPLLGVVVGGSYLLRERVGSLGRFGHYTAEERVSGREVLVTAAAVSELGESQARFFRERATRLSSLEHAACLPLLDFGAQPADGLVYLVEPGPLWPSLREELERKGPLPVSVVLALVNQLLDSLDYLHGEREAHGGLCSQALRLARADDGAPRLRIPLAALAARTIDPAGEAASEHYKPLGGGTTGLQADLYAAALLLAEMLLGTRPAAGQTRLDLGALKIEAETKDLLSTVLEKGLQQGVAPGYGSAWEFRRDLETLTGQTRFGRYELLHRIARGGMGEIYLARAEGIKGIDIDRFCVIKTIKTSLSDDRQFVERFLSEARVLASLSCGNIVPVYDVGKVGTTFYIAMEYVAGQDLRGIMARASEVGKRLPVPLALFIAKELANGLAYAHRAKVAGEGGLVHRDVSPHNVLVSYEGDVRLIDFGLAQGPKGVSTTEEGTVMGKLCYLSPEQAVADPLDRRTDIYSAGLVLFELLTGEPFFNQDTVEQVMALVACPDPGPPSARTKGIPKEVDRICLKAMAPDREQRYVSAGDLRDDLAAELARIAPRTNPEEVGAFVRELFPDEQIEQERVLSDLSVTLPPADTAAAMAPTEPQQVQEVQDPQDPQDPQEPQQLADSGSAAISLLGQRPQPIQLESTVAGLDDVLQLPPTQVLRPSVSGEILEDAVLAPPPRRSRAGLIVGIILVLGAGLVGGIWISRITGQSEDERRDAQLQAFRSLVVNQQHTLTGGDAGASAPAGNAPDPVDQGPALLQVTKKRRLPLKLRVVGKPLRRTCRLRVKGGPRGAAVFINARRKGTLPLSAPVQAPAGAPFMVKVSRPDMTPTSAS